MKTTFLVVLLAMLPQTVSAQEFPKRKPGLWELQTGQAGRGGNTPPVKQCIDEATDATMQQWGNQMSEACSKRETRREGDVYIIDSDCTVAGSHVIAHGVIKGDFASSYEGEILSKYNPPLGGMKEGKVVIKARWLGPCEKGQQPGDLIMPGGMKMNVNSLMKRK